jgi:hypothetical protein
MLRRGRLVALLVVAAAVLPLCGLQLFGQEKSGKTGKDTTPKAESKAESKDKATLRWKFEKDKPFYQKMTTNTKQTMTVMSNQVQQNQEQVFWFSYTPEKQEGDNWTIQQKIIGVKMDIDIGGSKISYDSMATTANNAQSTTSPLSEFFKQLVGSQFKLTLDTKTLKVTKVEGQKEFVEKLVKANPQMKPLLEQILSEKALIEMAEPTFAVLPTEPKAPGESWTRKTTLDMGPIGKYDNEYKYTYEGKETEGTNKGLDKIKVDTTLTYHAPSTEAAGVGGLPFKIKDAKLKSEKATGTIYFNKEKGRVEKSNMTLDLKGELNIDIGGQTTKVDLVQTQTTELETLDKDPMQKK